jgi:hypothetical protein
MCSSSAQIYAFGLGCQVALCLSALLLSLVPEKIAPIAYWIIKQMKGEHPEWFIADKP